MQNTHGQVPYRINLLWVTIRHIVDTLISWPKVTFVVPGYNKGHGVQKRPIPWCRCQQPALVPRQGITQKRRLKQHTKREVCPLCPISHHELLASVELLANVGAATASCCSAHPGPGKHAFNGDCDLSMYDLAPKSKPITPRHESSMSAVDKNASFDTRLQVL
jgi:hypothetical protein